MSGVLACLQALPVAPAGARVATTCRVLAQTPEGRAQVAAFVGRAADLLGEDQTYMDWTRGRAERAVQEGDWQASFEAGGDTGNALAYALHRALPPLGFRPAYEVQQARYAEINDLCSRLLWAAA